MKGSLTCRQVASLLTEYRERTLPWTLRIRTGLHLRVCPDCLRLLLDLEALPSILQRLEPREPIDLQPIGQAALAYAMARLHDPRPPTQPSEIPGPVQSLLSQAADLPLRLMAQAHAAILRGEAPASEPFLPDDVLSQLSPVQEWKWHRSAGGVRRALLVAEGNGPTLSLVRMPPGFSSATHVHHGTESLLVLEGELEQADRCLTNGDWIHLEEGSSHAPSAYGRGCWCLVREEGTVQYGGALGWFRGMRAGA